MKRAADCFKEYPGTNPFKNMQGRNFSNEKIVEEFQPITKFWNLFNPGHEVIIGTRGSGKTFLLKMMRRSMLRQISHQDAQRVVSEKKYLSLYVPMHLEFIGDSESVKISDERRKDLFLLKFNYLLAHSLLLEIQDFIKDKERDYEKEVLLTAKICNYIDKTWFDQEESHVYTIDSLLDKIENLFYKLDRSIDSWDKAPCIFRIQLCAPLLVIKDHLERSLDLHSPTWIICIDEAEFLPKDIQKIINSLFRSDSNGIAIKIATLPFKHLTLETTVPDISIEEGDDFRYSFIDLDYESQDFIDLTNKLCRNRLNGLSEGAKVNELKDFLGTVNEDKLIDYYRLELGDNCPTTEELEARIISLFKPEKKSKVDSYSNKRKAVYDKYAPVLFVREMYERSKGHASPGWYAGSDVVRKISQGNPRIFLQVMCALFEKARVTSLAPKKQHQVLLQFADTICAATESLSSYGPIINSCLNKIAKKMQDSVHGEYIVNTGSSFVLSFDSELVFKDAKNWIQSAIARSRLIVDDDIKKTSIKKDTIYLLSNSYATKYWLPMRKGDPVKIKSDEIQTYKQPSFLDNIDSED